ncbi:MAG TPA: hypothetical protein VFR85_00740 [Anaeromyxobacteraceae bacterium]|nr:hypothetical protein [Anaeromyxobacteraceae bacterium]
MLKRMVLAGLLTLAAAPVLAADTASDRRAPVSTDEARVLAGKQIKAQEKAASDTARACSCKHG